MSPRSFLVTSRCAPLSLGLIVLSVSAALPSPVWAQEAPTNSATSIISSAAPRAVSIEIDDNAVQVSPQPVITRAGSVLVPLRGVLEKLGATVSYVARDNRIDVRQGGKLYVLRVGQKSAIADAKVIPLTAAPQLIERATYVPLRSLVELFGYRIEWDNATKTVSIDTQISPTDIKDHRAALQAAGDFGVTVDFSDATVAEVPLLLDAAKRSGADIIQTRFDWQTVQSTKGAAFDWSIYDLVVREAKSRNLLVVGILGDSAQWASLSSASSKPSEWRFSAPKPSELKSFQTYVQRTVERYRNDVQAWQVWDNPASYKFRAAGAAQYRNVVKLAVQAARRADPKAVVHAAEPGGVNLSFVREMQRDGFAGFIDGLNVFPVSQWQPGIEASTSEFARPFAALGGPIGISKTRWVGGLTWPVFDNSTSFQNANDETRQRLQSTFTPQAQADYATRASALALALGAEKVFWDRLRDEAAYDVVEPANPEAGSGLLRRDGTPRLSYAAWQATTRLLRGKKYVGALATGPDVVALTFDDGKESTVVAWSPNGRGKLIYNATGDPQVPDSTYIEVREGALALDAIGNPLPDAPGTIELGRRTVWLSPLTNATTTRAIAQGKRGTLKLQDDTAALPAGLNEVAATFGESGEENGLNWRKYNLFRGQARKTSQIEGQSGLVTEIPPDIFHPNDGRPYIFFDVDDDFLFAESGTPLTLTVRVGRTRRSNSTITDAKAGFDIEYNTPAGWRNTNWQVVEEGQGWIEYSIDLPDASFGNVNGYDFKINTFGSKQNLVFGEIKVSRKAV